MLRIYAGVQPNNAERHYYFDTLEEYKAALSSHLVKSETLDNYRINGNVARLKIDGVSITEASAFSITYLIDETTNHYRCYNVINAVIQSGFVILNLSVDLWASYLPMASLSHINVMRSNRRLGVGVLDEINATSGNRERSFAATIGTSGEGNEYMDISRVNIVFALKYNIQQNNAGSVSRVGLFAFNLLTLKRALYDANKQGGDDPTPAQLQNNFNWSIVNPVQFAIDVVSGIYGVEGANMWGISGTLNAAVLGAWLTDNIVVTSQSNLTIKTKANWQNFNDVTLTPLEVINVITQKTLSFSNDFNKQFYVGTLQNGLKLQRRDAVTNSLIFSTIPSNDKLTFIISDGDNQLDVTAAFSVVVGMTDGDVTAERQVIDVIQNSVKAIGSAIALGKGIASGSGFATAIGINSMAGSLAAEISKSRTSHVGNIVSGGDGLLAYWRLFTGNDMENPENNLTTPVSNPYVINAFASIENEGEHARQSGAKYSVTIAALNNVFDYPLIGSGSSTDTFLQANVCVGGVPTEACDLIRGRLSGGIYLLDVRSND